MKGLDNEVYFALLEVGGENWCMYLLTVCKLIDPPWSCKEASVYKYSMNSKQVIRSVSRKIS